MRYDNSSKIAVVKFGIRRAIPSSHHVPVDENYSGNRERQLGNEVKSRKLVGSVARDNGQWSSEQDLEIQPEGPCL